MKTVYLHGKLGKRFGKKWSLNVGSVREAFSALEANSEGFFEYILDCAKRDIQYIILAKSPSSLKNEGDFKKYAMSPCELNMVSNSKEIHIVSKTEGSITVAIVKAILVAVAVQVVMSVLFKPPKPPERKDPTNTKSYLIAGAINRQAQGIAVPLGYGKLKIGASNIATRQTSKRFRSSTEEKSLESYSEIEILDLLSEGPIEGFINKNGGTISGGDIREGIFLNNVQVKNTPRNLNDEGTLNYVLNENEDSEEGKPKFKDGDESDSTILSDEVFSIREYNSRLYGSSPYGRNKKYSGGKKEYEIIQEALSNDAKIFSHFVSNENVGKVSITIKSNLYVQNDDGSTSSNNIRFAILITRSNGEFNVLDRSSSKCIVEFEQNSGLTETHQDYDSYFTLDGIATSPYQFDINISYNPKLNKEEISGGVTFKVIRLSAEYDPSVKGGSVGGIAKRRDLEIAHIVEIIKQPMLYPHSSICKLVFDGKNFSNIPERSYHVRLKKVLIPSNYDPVSRKYDGPWDGLFLGQSDSLESVHSIADRDKRWTDNPAWIFYDLLHNARYGVGKYGLEEENIDKWQLYKVAKYCDELVETNYPIETESAFPRMFETDNNLLFDEFIEQQNSEDSNGLSNLKSNGSFTVKIKSDNFYNDNGQLKVNANAFLTPGEIKDKFTKEFGDGDSFRGKKIAFFIHQNNADLSSLSDADILNIQKKSAIRSGEIIIEERIILRSNATNREVTLAGPTFSSNPMTSADNKTYGACATQISHPIVEARFSSNIYLTDRVEALNVMNNTASVFRGIIAYSAGKIIAVQDAFKRPVQLFNNSNVSIDGFSYAGVNKNKKFTACLVRFNNKDKNYQPDVAFEEDADAMQKFGYVENETMGFGITSESQARRLAKWILFSSQLETETITFKTGQEASYLFPGAIFEVSDEMRAGSTKSGRILDIQMHKQVAVQGQSSQLNVKLPDPYVLIDKSTIEAPSFKRVELTVCVGLSNSSQEKLNARAAFERSSEDQDAEASAILTPQIYKFDGTINSDFAITKEGPRGQASTVSDLKLKLSFDLDLADNLFKIFNHSFEDGDRVRFVSDGVLPGGLNPNRVEKYAYYVIETTKNTFKVSEELNGQPVNVVDIGKDILNNIGGDHYLCPESGQKTADALDQIMIGSPYSIKGTVGTKSKKSLSNQERSNLGIISSPAAGWSVSNYFGYIYSQDQVDWIMTVNIGWIYVGQIKERQPSSDDLWFFIPEVGWVWTTDSSVNDIKNDFWYIDSHKQNNSTASGWVIPYYDSSKRENIVQFFVYDTDTSYQVGQDYLLGSTSDGAGKKYTISEIGFSNSVRIGYFLTLTNRSSTVETKSISNSTPTGKNRNDNPNYISATISSVVTRNPQESIQNQNSIAIELQNGHGGDLRNNQEIFIEAFSSDSTNFNNEINKKWRIIIINENVFELINSGQAYTHFSSISNVTNNGEINFIRDAKSIVERSLEGQLFRTMSVKEVQDNEYEVVGLEYNASKFAAVDKKGVVRKPTLPIPPQADMAIPEAPDGLQLIDLTN